MKQLCGQRTVGMCFVLLLIGCGTAGDSGNNLEPIIGVYKTQSHLVNPSSCSEDGTDHADTPMRGALVWHDTYFQIIDGFMPGSRELEWCPNPTGNGCSFSLFTVQDTSEGWLHEAVQAGGQEGFDCSNQRRTWSATYMDNGHLRLEHRVFTQNVPEGSSDCSLNAAYALEGDEYCAGYEVIVGSPVD